MKIGHALSRHITVGIFLAVLLSLNGCSIVPNSAGTVVYHNTNTVAVIGDSISAGVNMQAGTFYGWVHMLNEQAGSLWPDTYAVISNFAMSGSTAEDWNTNTAWLSSVISWVPDFVIVYIGGNDFLNSFSDGVFSPAETANLSNNYRGIFDKLTNQLTNAKLLAVSYYDLFDGFSMALTNIPAAAQYSNMSSSIASGNSLLSNIAVPRGARFVDVYPSFLHHGYGGDLGDTGHLTPDYLYEPLLTHFDVHPVTAGHQTIRDLVKSVLTNL